MILIGQFDSPFVRRVGIALKLYALRFEHRPWSTFGDGDKIVPYNPLRRVPTLVLDNGEALIESFAILDYLDERVGPARALIPDAGDARLRELRICALATGLADKAVILFYERALHKETSQAWVDRCRTQISAVLDVLERERAAVPTPYWHGKHIGHADIAVACALKFVREAHSNVYSEAHFPALTAHAASCEALPVFKEIAQAFIRRRKRSSLRPHRLRRVGLRQRMRFGEGRQRHCRIEDALHHRIGREIALRVDRRRHVADHADVGKRRRVAVTELPCGRVTGQMRLEAFQRLDDPVPGPFLPHGRVQLQLVLQIFSHARRQQGVAFAGDHLCKAAHARTATRIGRQQRRFWIHLIQVFDDRKRLEQDRPVAVDERRQHHLRIDLAIRIHQLHVGFEIDAHDVRREPFQVERDTDAKTRQ